MERRNNTEFYINLYQKFNKFYIEDIINNEVDELLLEKYYKGQKIDIYTNLKDTWTPVFVESMISKSDTRHLEFILKLINKIKTNQKAIIIFEALNFDNELVEIIINKIRETGKLINFYVVEINRDFLDYIEELNGIHFLKVIDILKEEINIEPFYRVQKYITTEEIFEEKKNEDRMITRIEGRNLYLLEELKDKLYYFPTIYREKSTLDNRILSFGSGRSGVCYFITAESRGKTYVYIKFEKITEYIYWNIKKKRNLFQDAIKYRLSFKDDELIISTNIRKEFIFKDMDTITKVFERYVYFFTNYILYYDKENYFDERMVQQHKEGIL